MKGWLPLYRIMTRMNKSMNEWMNASLPKIFTGDEWRWMKCKQMN